jgi:hypothetical protein
MNHSGVPNRTDGIQGSWYCTVEVAIMDYPLRYPVWQESYLAAMLEMNSVAKRAKIAAAQDAIRKRIVSNGAAPEEHQAIQDALNALRFLNR